MNNIRSIFVLFSLLVGIMLLGLWSNIHAYAQQSTSSTTTGGSVSKPISSELKAKMCDPSNPELKVVNTTEARICGIAKTVKPALASAIPTPQSTSAVFSSSPTTKPATTVPTKQQQIANNIPRSSGTGSTIAPLSHPTSTSPSGIAPQVKAVKQQQQPPVTSPITLSNSGTTIAPLSHPTSTSPSGIAPQMKAINQQQQPPAALPITAINSTAVINSTAGQNYTFAATSPTVPSDQVLYVGYHGTTSNPTHGNSGSKHHDTHDNNSHDNTRTASDSSSKDKDTNDGSSTVKKKTTNTKSDRTESTNVESSSKGKNTHNTDSSSDSSSSSKKWTRSNDGSPKQDDDSSSATSSSDSENVHPSVIVKSFNPKHSDSSESSSIDDHIPSVIMKSFNFD
jgi:hypothetical protein